MVINCRFGSRAVLAVNVKEIETIAGNIYVLVYDNEADYEEGEAVFTSKTEVTQFAETVVFDAIADGEYAIKLFHDANENKKLDINFIGIPKERYGFSNNRGRFGEPRFEAANFAVKAATTIEIVLK